MNRIAVGFMVKNESKIIERCLASLLHLQPELVVITDTGSTDDTMVRAGVFLQDHNIKFKIYQEPFQNFGFNRTKLLEYIGKEADIDYVMMIDADDTLQYHESFTPESFRQSLDGQIYNITYNDGLVSYYLPKLTSNKITLKYVGVTHEFLDAKTYWQKSSNLIWVRQGTDSFRRVNNLKNPNDISLLTKALEGPLDEKLRIRYLFYLAQAHLANQDTRAAASYYKLRTQYQGWDEELFYAHYQLGKIYQEMGEAWLEDTIYHYLSAYMACPKRVESLVNLKYYFEEKGMGLLATLLLPIIKSVPHPQGGLFVEDYKYYAFGS
jgi:glycosyltransferase involved in cell wall biosynthesis